MKTIPGVLHSDDERKVTDLIEVGPTLAAHASIDGSSSDETKHLIETRVVPGWHQIDARAKRDVTIDSATLTITSGRQSAPRPLLRRRKLVSLEVFVPSLVVN